MNIIIYHNPRCSKSRKTLELISSRGITPETIDYLNQPPTREQLRYILKLLSMGPRDLIRKQEQIYMEKNLADPALTDDQLIDAIITHPKLMERPIVINGDRAVLGRPPENVLEIL